jgi:hypothetical protein
MASQACGSGGTQCQVCLGAATCQNKGTEDNPLFRCGIDPESSWLVLPVAAEIATTGRQGAWDDDGTPPDVMVSVRCGVTTGKTPTSQSYTPTWSSAGCTVKAKELLGKEPPTLAVGGQCTPGPLACSAYLGATALFQCLNGQWQIAEVCPPDKDCVAPANGWGGVGGAQCKAKSIAYDVNDIDGFSGVVIASGAVRPSEGDLQAGSLVHSTPNSALKSITFQFIPQ